MIFILRSSHSDLLLFYMKVIISLDTPCHYCIYSNTSSMFFRDCTYNILNSLILISFDFVHSFLKISFIFFLFAFIFVIL